MFHGLGGLFKSVYSSTGTYRIINGDFRMGWPAVVRITTELTIIREPLRGTDFGICPVNATVHRAATGTAGQTTGDAADQQDFVYETMAHPLIDRPVPATRPDVAV